MISNLSATTIIITMLVVSGAALTLKLVRLDLDAKAVGELLLEPSAWTRNGLRELREKTIWRRAVRMLASVMRRSEDAHGEALMNAIAACLVKWRLTGQRPTELDQISERMQAMLQADIGEGRR